MKLLKTALKEVVSKGRPHTVITLLCQLQAWNWFHWLFVFYAFDGSLVKS